MKKIFLLLGCCSGIMLGGAVYHVSPAGNDKNAGTSAGLPLRTVSCALKKVQSGDTILIRGGIYREQLQKEWRQKNTAPVTIKAYPDETPVITFAWQVKNWKKRSDGLFVADFPYAVCDLWQKLTLDRYLKMASLELLKRQPGGFWQDPADGKIYVNPLNGSWHDDPEKAGFAAVPYGNGTRPFPFNSKKTLGRRSGLALVGNNIVVDGLSFEFHQACGVTMRGRRGDDFQGAATVRNCSVVGTTLGIKCGWNVNGAVIENCRVIRNSGGGIQLGDYLKYVTVRNNFLLDNGSNMPFYGNYTTTSGHVFNLSRYGGSNAENVDIIGNKVISLDKSRKGGLMRCKGGIRVHTNQLNNLFVGGSVTLYSVPGSTATIKNNTLAPGKFYFTTPTSGLKYTPDMKDNLELSGDWRRKSRFANPGKYDFRLLQDSPHLGKGFAPGKAPVWFMKPGSKEGSGRIPEKPLASFARLQENLKSGDTVYFMPGRYSGTLVLKNLKNIVLSDHSFNKARWQKVQVDFVDCQNVQIENMDFRECTFSFVNSTVSFKESFFAGTQFNGSKGKIVFENSHLEKSRLASSGRVVLKENLLDSMKVSARDVVSEHNAFASSAEFKAWPFKETFKSFCAAENGKVPLKNLLWGSRGTWIGRRVVPDKMPPLQVADCKVTPLDCGTKAVLTWNTPKDYVRVQADVFQGKKKVFSGRVSFGDYLTCSGAMGISGLSKGQSYQIHVRLFRHNESKSWLRKMEFRTPDTIVKNVPRVIRAGKGTRFPRIADALLAARNGDTIEIMPGTYPESLTVYADGLTIKAKPGTVKISGEYMFDCCLQASDVKGLTIDGIDFTGLRYSSKTKALYIQRAEKVKVLNCRFFPNARGGCSNVQLSGRLVKGFEVRNCVFNSGFHGLWLMEAEDVTVDHNTFWGIGINAIHIGGAPGTKVVITNNLSEDVVANHQSPAISIGEPRTRYICDWNLYWHTAKKCPRQQIFGVGGKLGILAVWQVMTKDVATGFEEARKRFKIEKNGLFADPKMKDPAKGDFSLAPDSPARKRGSDGKDIGADLSVFSSK